MATETDCPICFEPMINGNEDCCMNGDNCNHKICIPCYCKISVSQNNKCPICRATLEGDNNDECDDEVFDGNNERPTTDLFEGRRWLNRETNKIEYFFIYLNQTGFHNSWTEIERKHFSTFIQRYLNRNYLEGCCYVCGIQKTTEVNEFMKNKYPDGFHVTIENDCWDYYFIEGYNNCYECYNMFVKLNDNFYTNG